MADDSDSTKAAFDKNWASATEAGEYLTQSNGGDWNRARTIIRDALHGGCRAALEVDQGAQKGYIFPPPGFWFTPNRLRWVNALNPSMRREDYPDHSWPWELRAYLSPSESWELRDIEGRPLAQAEAGVQQAGEQARQALLMDLESYGIDPSAGRYAALDQAREQVSMLRVFLPRTNTVQWGLLSALEFPQAVASEESPSPDKQLNDPAVGIRASAHAQTAPEQSETPPPAPAAETAPAAPKPIEPAATEPALPSTLAVSKPAQSSLEVPVSASPPPQEPTPIALLVKAALAAPASLPPPPQQVAAETPQASQPQAPQPKEPQPQAPQPKEPVVQSSGDKKTEKTAKDFVYAKDFVPWAVKRYARDTVGVPDYPEYLRKLAGNKWSKKTIQNELSKLK